MDLPIVPPTREAVDGDAGLYGSGAAQDVIACVAALQGPGDR